MTINLSQLSKEAQLALLPQEARDEVLRGLDLGALNYSIDFKARPSQKDAIYSDATITLLLAGRGFGKNWTASQWVRENVRLGKPPTQGFLAARTAADVRTIINGKSGLMNIFPPSERPVWIPSQRIVKFANGSIALCLSAKEPDQGRGPSADWALCDEWAAWDFSRNPEEGEADLWENIQIATRDALHPRVMITTTPKRIQQVRDLVAKALSGEHGIRLITGSTFENTTLSADYLEFMRNLHLGTKLGEQELFARILDEVMGALWTEAMIEHVYTLDDPGKLPLRVVGVDPSVAEVPTDECGIVVMGATNESRPEERRGWVLADFSDRMAPSKWAKTVVAAARQYDAVVVAEANQGGAMVKEMIHNVDRRVKVVLVHAKVSKKLRAEPVATAYEQDRVRHLGNLPFLNDQLTSWIPDIKRESPDRIDAMVHAATALLLPSGKGLIPGPSRVSSPPPMAIPTGATAASRNTQRTRLPGAARSGRSLPGVRPR